MRCLWGYDAVRLMGSAQPTADNVLNYFKQKK